MDTSTIPKSLTSPSRMLTIKEEWGIVPDYVQISIKTDRATGELFGENIETGHSYTIRELSSLANDGDIHAQCAMGDYYSAPGESFDPKSACMWHEKAAQQGHPKAQGLFAGDCIVGLGTKKDIAKAEFWAKKSAAQNSPTGMSVLCHCCLAKDDYSAAVYWLEKAIKYGYPDGESLLNDIREIHQTSGQPKVREQDMELYLSDNASSVDPYKNECRGENFQFSTKSLVEADTNFDKIFPMLQNMYHNHPKAFTAPQIFRSLAVDLLENDSRFKGIIRWLVVSLFELSALTLLKESHKNGDGFARHKLVDRLINEGAPPALAKEVVAYITLLAEMDAQQETR